MTEGVGAYHRQRCPICQIEGGRFHYKEDDATFRCPTCKFNDDIIGLVAKVRNISHAEAATIVAGVIGYVEDTADNVIDAQTPSAISSEDEQAVAAHVENSRIGEDSISDSQKVESPRTPKLSVATMASVGKEYVAKNLCALPADKASKYPTIKKWKEYQYRLPTDEDWHTWDDISMTAICIVAGKISGCLLVIDFDDGGSSFNAWWQLIPQELRDKITLVVRTPSGGYHVYLRCDGNPIGNVKLAYKKAGAIKDGKQEYKTLIETRGEGGLVIAPPTPGYEIKSGSFDAIPVVSRDDMNKLLEAARSFCEKQTGDALTTTQSSSSSIPKQEQTKPVTPPARPALKNDSRFDWFVESCEWRNHLGDLEELGWVFLDENEDGQLFFQTPDGDHEPGKQDGNVKDGVVYFFSKTPPPFVEDKGYSICQLFAGALFGDTGKRGLAKFAKQYLQPSVKKNAIPPTIIFCGVDVLDNILERIEPIDWDEFETTLPGGGVKPPNERDYLLRTCEQILGTADTEKTPLVHHESGIHYYTGTHYKPINEIDLKNFLIEAAIRCDVPSDTAVYQTFVEKVFKQFLINSARYSSSVAEPETVFINLKNGTLFFDKSGHRFEKHDPKRFIRYCLHFDYDPNATAPLWQKHIDRSLPMPEKQLYLAECLALAFYQGKIEAAPIFQGERDTGKSTTLDVFKALVGVENWTAESLAMLSRDDVQGGYARARLAGKLVNIASDIGKKMNDEGMTKTLISREAVAARNPYGIGFDMRNYGRLMFAMNNMPPQFLTDAALTKRAAIVVFDQQIKEEDVVTGFAESIIANELPGVLNWIIAGLERLLKTCRLDPPQCCVEGMERLRKENDPVSAWLDDQGYYPGNSESLVVKYVYPIFVEYCKDNGNQVLSTKTFTQRLRNQGYEVYAPNNHVGVKLFYTTINPNSHPHVSPDTENRDETGEHTGSNSASLPDGSPVVPSFDATKQGVGKDGNNGNDIWEQVFIDLDEDDPFNNNPFDYVPFGDGILDTDF